MAGSIPASPTAEAAVSLKASQPGARKRVSASREALRRFRRHRLAVPSAMILGLILVAAITFIDVAVESHDARTVLFLGLAIAVVILALTAFLRFGRSHKS